MGSASGSQPITEAATLRHINLWTLFSRHIGTGRPDLLVQTWHGHRGRPGILQETVALPTKGRAKRQRNRAEDDPLEIPENPTEVGMRVGGLWRGTKSAWSLLTEWSLAPSQLATP